MSDFGADPLLSKEEADALLAAMQIGEVEEIEADAVDLTSPERALRDATTRADRCARELAQRFPRLFLRNLGTPIDASDEPTELVPMPVLVTAIAPGAAVAVLRTRDESRAYLVLGPTLVSYILERRLGVPVDDDADPVTVMHTNLSAVDRRIIRPLCETLATEFGLCWCEDPNAFRVEDVLARAEDMPDRAHQIPVLRTTLSVEASGMASDSVFVALTSGAIMSTAPREEAHEPVSASDQDRRRMRSALTGTEVDCVTVLGTARFSIREVLQLHVGDVLRLDTIPGEPIGLVVGDITVARGVPVVHHGNLALQVTETR